MKPRIPLVVGNWKMHGDLAANARLLAGLRAGTGAGIDVGLDAALLARVEVGVAPPYVYLGQVADMLRDTGISWGAQDVAGYDGGAYTGEVSAAMLRDVGCAWSIVGHSERRALFAESDAVVAGKAACALAQGLSVIICIGETLQDREADRTEAVLGAQIAGLAEVLSGPHAARVVMAYEPVWAIGTGRSATPDQAQDAHRFIRARLADAGAEAAQTRILYGGSVKPGSAASLFAMPDIDGGLIGGASLVAEEFVAICRAAAFA